MSVTAVISAWTSKDKVRLAYRDARGVLRFSHVPAVYTAYVRELPDNVMDDSRVIGHHPDHPGWYRIEFRDYDARKGWCYEHPETATFENDVSPVKRFMADTDTAVQAPRRCFWDIETDSRVSFDRKEEARILTWSVRGMDGRLKQGCLTHDTDIAEKDLIEEMEDALCEYDCIASWNGFHFDEPVRKARMTLHRLWPDRRLLFVDQMKAYEKMNRAVAGDGEEKTSVALGNVGKALCGISKTQTPQFIKDRFGDKDLGALTYELWAAGGKFREALLEYNAQDTEVQRQIELHTGFLDALQSICEVCHIFPNTSALNSMSEHDSWFLRKAREMGTHLPSKVEREEQPEIQGAFVRPPTVRGILKDVSVVDFASLYPSIIISLNLDYTTKDPTGTITSPGTGVKYRSDIVGMMPMGLVEFQKLRDVHKKARAMAVPKSDEWKSADRLQNVAKVLMNSAYGIMASIYCRFYDPEIAESVTLTGQWLLKSVETQLELQGYRVLYSDTDGVMFDGATHEQSVEFSRWFNEDFIPGELKKLGCVTNKIKLAYQERFSRLVFPLGKDGDPSSKRYVGRFSVYEGHPVTDYALEIKGIEIKRGDSSRLGRQLQQSVVDIIMQGEENGDVLEKLILEWKKRITEDELPIEDISISKSVKDLGSYAVRFKKDGSQMTQAAHVEVAKLLQKRGEDISSGSRIRYVIVDASVSPQAIIPASDYTGEFDRAHLWNESVYAPTMRLLQAAFTGHNWKHWRIRRGKKTALPGQVGLGL